MVTTIFEKEFARIDFESDLKLVSLTWKGGITSEQYHEAFEQCLDYIGKNEVDCFLSDIRRQSVVSPNDRKWFSDYVMPTAVSRGLKFGAVVFDGSAFKKYYLNIILGFTMKLGLPTKFFSTIDDAHAWFQEKRSKQQVA